MENAGEIEKIKESLTKFGSKIKQIDNFTASIMRNESQIDKLKEKIDSMQKSNDILKFHEAIKELQKQQNDQLVNIEEETNMFSKDLNEKIKRLDSKTIELEDKIKLQLESMDSKYRNQININSRNIRQSDDTN